MEHRHLGRSGLKVSEIAYGNWITHGSQVEEDAARACVAAALDEGITTFDTADVYAGTRAEEVLGRALHGVRRESVEIATKVYWPTGAGPNDRGLSRKHIIESVHGSLRRLQTDYLDLYQAHRYDHETPLPETLRAFEDLVRQGKVLYVGVSEWRAEEIAAALRIADEMGFDRIVSNQPQYNMIWRVIESEVVPLCEKEGIGQIVFSPIAQGILTGKYRPGEPLPAAVAGHRSRAGPDSSSASSTTTCSAGWPPCADRRGGWPVHGPAGRGLGAAEPQRVGGDHWRDPAGAGPGERQGLRGPAGRRRCCGASTTRWARDPARPLPNHQPRTPAVIVREGDPPDPPLAAARRTPGRRAPACREAGPASPGECAGYGPLDLARGSSGG